MRRPAAFIVRDPDHPLMDKSSCTFAFDMSGSLLPSQLVGSPDFSSPPPTGMKWVDNDGNEDDYRNSEFYLKWNKILSRHDTLTVHKLDNPNDFYDICRKISWILNY